MNASEDRRITALEGACRVVSPNTPTSTLLSRAREIETYLAAGIVSHDSSSNAATVHVGPFAVTVVAPLGKLTPGIVEAIREAIERAIPAEKGLTR